MAGNGGDRSASVKAKDTTPDGGQQVKVKWDDSNMRSVYANVCNASGTKEEVVLLFGMNQAWHSGQSQLTIQLSDRVMMSPFVAKRLATLLNNVIKGYEEKYGALDA